MASRLRTPLGKASQTFQTIEQKAQSLPIPVLIPEERLEVLRQQRQARYTPSSFQQATCTPTPQAEFSQVKKAQKVKISEVQLDAAPGSKFRLWCMMGVLVLSLFGSAYLLSTRVSLQGSKIDSRPYAKILPVQEVRLHEKTLFIKVKPAFIKYPSTKKVRLIFMVKRAAAKWHKARSVVVVGANDRLLARVGHRR